MTNNPPKRALPLNPHQGHLRKEAKARLASLKSRMPSVRLADVQLILAREYGFPNWGMLQAEAARQGGRGRQMRKAIAAAWLRRHSPIDVGHDEAVGIFFRAGLMAQVGFIIVALTGVALVLAYRSLDAAHVALAIRTIL